ncbi:MerR family transcriptional regulator [Mycobacterium camsae]|uniref:MerR family transcriptional regulator n=1 Tax=Mycobacterium gordonae TaxID=1778 RepID=UPI001982442B|nr:helix-turn-helix transcriptional regulator [Mycobacterium gordonae]
MTVRSGDAEPPSDQGVYGISVAAELSGVAVQSLRLYERYGLVTPARSDGGTRRYSADDLARLRRISALVEAGVNLAGIARILSLEDDNAELSAANSDLRSANRSLRGAVKQAAAEENPKNPARKSAARKG